MDEEKKTFVPLEIIDKMIFDDDEFPDEFGNKKTELKNIDMTEGNKNE